MAGDLVCSRYAIRLLLNQYEVSVMIREKFAPLLDGLPVELIHFRDRDELASRSLDELCRDPARFSRFIDLQGDRRFLALIRHLPGTSVGYDEPDVGIVYDEPFPWRGPDTEGVHTAVRNARAVRGYEAHREFDLDEWRRAFFTPRLSASKRHVALCPGSGRGGSNKRFANEGWRAAAAHIRALGAVPVWFIGPDEVELIPELVLGSDEVEDGDFASVIARHSACAIGLSNDTVHLHIRAHLPLETGALFVRGEAREWGGYPENVRIISAPPSRAMPEILSELGRWIDSHYAPH